MAVAIHDAAKAAGVSASTLSRAMLLPKIVEASTRDRVLWTSTNLGYQPDRAVRGPIAGRTGNLGLIAPDLFNPSYTSRSNAGRAGVLWNAAPQDRTEAM